MVFNSATFIIFLAVTVLLHYLLPAKFRNAFLLAASCVFYMWTAPIYGLTLAVTTAAGYLFASEIASGGDEKKKRGSLAFAVALLLFLLIITKYLEFFTDIASRIAMLFGAQPLSGTLRIIVPLGISFYTLQLIGYLVDVKNGKAQFEKNIVNFALFISFFPQILSGPIGRAGELLPQIKAERGWDYSATVDGLLRFMTGAFKKVVLANGFAFIVNGMYGTLRDYRGLSLALFLVLYSVQLLCDFSGYTDMAIGAAKLFGITLRENFSAPYFSTNFSTFWSRWHISLSSWLQDYVFVPLVWSRWWNKLFFGKKWEEKPPHFLANIIIVFLVSGLWHGAAYTFVVWGLIQGLYRVGEELLHKWRKRPKKLQNKTLNSLRLFGKRLAVFAMWTLSLAFFRAESVSDALYILKNVFVPQGEFGLTGRVLQYAANGVAASGTYYLIYFGCLAAGLLLFARFEAVINRSLSGSPCHNPLSLIAGKKRWLVYWFMIISTLAFHLISLTGESAVSFIYLGF